MENEIFEKYSRIVEKYSELILNAEKYIYANPETGYKEFKTSKYLEEEFEKLGYVLDKPADITGFCTEIDTGRPGPKVLIFGELDSVICAEHPLADKTTGAVHSCGHCCQTAALLGIAAALKTPGALDGLSGSVKLCAVPAEEILETDFREDLCKKGTIKYYGGKIEFMRRGYFDDVDLAFMAHTTSLKDPHSIAIRECSNGTVMKEAVFKGFAAHAGGSPDKGINALYAATLGFNAVNAIRETVVDGQYGRVHSIITNGGQIVNAIPATVCVTTQVRGKTNDVIKKLNNKVNRAYAGAAASMGAKLEIHDRPGYSPVMSDLTMAEICLKAAGMCTTPDRIFYQKECGGGCSDIGDIQMVMPALHPYVSGATGTSHGADYYITDPESACIFSAEFQLVFLHELLKDGAAEAKRVIKNSNPPCKTKAEYFALIDSFFKDKEVVTYKDDGSIVLDF